MPVILKPNAYNPWLSPDNQAPDALQEIFESLNHTELKAVPVSKLVSSLKNNSEENIQPVEQA
jgi:putative SOS response-associated peptidase YedK